MIRVLQVVNNMDRAGLETMLMNYYRNLDREQYQFDFLMHRKQKSDYDDEIVSFGGQIFRAPRLYPQNYPAYFKFMKRFFEQHKEYKIVHSHIDAMSYLPLLAAKRACVPVRIAHSHNTSIDVDWKYPLKSYYKKKIPQVATYYCACGKLAGEFLFPNQKFQVICNAVDMEKYKFSSEIRNKMRRSLNIENNFVIGHVGRFSYAKNHERILRIFRAILKKNETAVLLFAGEGEREKRIRTLAQDYGIAQKVFFLGKRNDMDKLYQAMDVLLMPSFFEGIPVVGIEAQSTGLTCVFSERVSDEVRMSENCYFISLEEKDEVWARTIVHCNVDEKRRMEDSEKNQGSRYNIKSAVNTLENLYEGLWQD